MVIILIVLHFSLAIMKSPSSTTPPLGTNIANEIIFNEKFTDKKNDEN